MHTTVGHVSALFRYPIKSMAGEAAEVARLGWDGLTGDRRYAFRRLADRSGFPWLTASHLPELLLYQPLGRAERAGEQLPTHVRTPDGHVFGIDDAALAADLAARLGGAVELMQLGQGIFDAASVSLISTSTVGRLEAAAGLPLDVRRFRPNVVVTLHANAPFGEDAWVGGVLQLGDGQQAPRVGVTVRDKRCVMINMDPDSAHKDARVMQATIRLNENNAGVYGTVLRVGELRVGDPVLLLPAV